jgi:lambda family phage portal protein
MKATRILDANGRPIVRASAPSPRQTSPFAAARARALMLRHEAARMDRVRGVARSGSADGDLLPDLRVLREKSRAMGRDDAHAAAAVRVLVDNVVGDGIRPQAMAKPEETGLTQTQCDEWNKAVERLWNGWAQRQADANEIGSFDDLTRTVFRLRVVDGEALAHRVLVEERGRQLRTAWELVDPDRLEDPGFANGDTRLGVEFGARGQPVAYWITPHHPDDLRFLTRGSLGRNVPERIERVRMGVWNVLHVYRRERPGQSRGIPLLTSALALFEHLHHYLDSEVIAARANANVAMFIKRPIDETDPDLQIAAPDHPRDDGASNQVWHETIEPGTIEYLNEGEEIQPFQPNRPGTTFDPFVIRMLRAISSGMGLPYELVTKDFGRLSYSAARTVLLEARRSFAIEQGTLITSWLQPAWETAIREGILSGALPVFPSMVDNLPAFFAAHWIRPAWGWVDPVKEIEAARLAVEANLSTPDIEAARCGLDSTDVLEARARFLVRAREIEKRNGLEPGSLTRERAERVEAVQNGKKPGAGGAGGAGGEAEDTPEDDQEDETEDDQEDGAEDDAEDTEQ